MLAPRVGEPGFKPRPLSDWWKPDDTGRLWCLVHDEAISERCQRCGYNDPPKAPPNLERPAYWFECEGDICAPPRPSNMGYARAVIGRGPRLCCEYHGSLHVTFALDEACVGCIREHIDEQKDQQ